MTLYRQLVGSLIYLTTTRPNLAYAISVLSQYMYKPLESHWNATKFILRYLQGIVGYGIIYTDSFDVRLTGFTISNWARNVDDRRSIIGCIQHWIWGDYMKKQETEHNFLVFSGSRV